MSQPGPEGVDGSDGRHGSDVPAWRDTPEVAPDRSPAFADGVSAVLNGADDAVGRVLDAVMAGVGSAPGPAVTPERVQLLHERATQVVPPLARTLRWTRWPSLLLLVVGAVAPLPLLVLALTWDGVPRLVGVVASLGAIVPALLFGISRRGTLRAAAAPGAVVEELTAFTSHLTDGLGIMDRIHAVTERGGGVRLLSRLRAIWNVLQLPADALDHLDAQEHLRWLVPPRVGETWARLVAMLWTAVGCVVLAVALGAVSLTGVL
ncbi:hypothetical protein [Litorihabitans aurantiacus]|uniref:Uncharacterized protein n=1 Tax=Litorihabitans aurantiacus TaxID=1930061 RepID=A0AA37UHE6_9MICO|nr:hypothetical protein [Litorihabitans aurantiacus]GMA30768.1 hypothetical protein GCM10025875_07600 [Litorihabitans aurantiacus]